MDRLLDETTPDWREGFVTVSTEGNNELERTPSEGRKAMGEGRSKRQGAALEELTAVDEESDETV